MSLPVVAGAVAIGVTLGLFGGGGSILTVPLLVYLAGMPAKPAIATSLFVVGVTSLAGLAGHARAGRIRWRTGLIFGLAGMAGAYGGGLLGPHLPAPLLLAAFAVMMLATAVAMIRGRRTPHPARRRDGELPLAHVLAEGAAVGLVTGLVGAGGGFLVVPALVLLGGMPMPAAVATSLVVIALKSFAGLAGYLHAVAIDWPVALPVTAAAVAGAVAGGRLAARVRAERLRRAFGWFVLAMGVVVLAGQAPPGLAAALPGTGWGIAALAAAGVLAAAALLAAKRAARRAAQRAGKPERRSTMFFARYYLDCLSQASYMVGDRTTGRAVVVDPRRDIGEYLADAERHGLRIEGVINTHFHADFLAGHLELAAATGAWIGYGSRAEAEYPIRKLADGERIELGDVVLEIMETPGHTPESISILVYEHATDPAPYGVLTGDTLFVGDVGRPDLLASLGYGAGELARMLHRSVRRLMELPGATRVYPAHGAGSACGKNLSAEPWSTIGEQRRTNHACAPMSEEEFVALVTQGQPPAPGYFGYDAVLNRKRHGLLDVAARAVPLTAEEVIARRDGGAVVLDTRDPQSYALAHLRGSISVALDGRFAERAGMVVTPGAEIVVVAPQDREGEVVTRLARIGFDNVAGYLREPEAAFLAVPGEVARSRRMTAAELRAALEGQAPPLFLLDVRNEAEAADGAIEDAGGGAARIPLAELPARLGEVPADRPVVVYCASGGRSVTAMSLLEREGRGDVADLIGGFQAWKRTAAPAAA